MIKSNLIIFYCITFAIICNTYANLQAEHFPGEECYRDCENAEPRICYFNWVMEHYAVLGPACGRCSQVNGSLEDCFNPQCVTADGLERGIMTINRLLPGPQIHVCKNDGIVVDITNAMAGTAASIHWHGIHQRETPWMDGVPYVTQCPIQFGTTFRYHFEATEAGTQFYHSHSGHHKVNGHYGGLIVRESRSADPNAELYTHDLKEHIILLSDWMDDDGEMFMPGLRTRGVGILPTNFLINGKGTRIDLKTRRPTTATPLEVYRVTAGNRYRFRLINAGSHACPLVLEIQKHPMTIIASDSFATEPITVDTLVTNSGERYDFVLDANETNCQYWMRVRGLGPCEHFFIEQFAVLSYASPAVDNIDLSYPTRRFPDFNVVFDGTLHRSLNHPHADCSGELERTDFCVTDLRSYVERPDITDVEPDFQFFLGFIHHRYNDMKSFFQPNTYRHFMNVKFDEVLTGAVNNLSFVGPPFSLLTQPELIDESMFCDPDHVPESCKGEEICACPYRIKIPLNAIVELVVVDETFEVESVNHPFHLHGYQLFVTEMGQFPMNSSNVNKAREMFENRPMAFSFNPIRFPIKDTISIPFKGYTIFRFKADNPGWWLLHCHYEWHAAVGMGLVVQVGELNEMVSPPPNFPKCNNYKPNILI